MLLLLPYWHRGKTEKKWRKCRQRIISKWWRTIRASEQLYLKQMAETGLNLFDWFQLFPYDWRGAEPNKAGQSDSIGIPPGGCVRSFPSFTFPKRELRTYLYTDKQFAYSRSRRCCWTRFCSACCTFFCSADIHSTSTVVHKGKCNGVLFFNLD